MNMRPQICNTLVYSDPNKKLLREWVWKTYELTFQRDRTIHNVVGNYCGFFHKSGTLYYAVIINNHTGKVL